MVIATTLTDWLPVIAAAIVAAGALIGIPLAHHYQALRERQRWIDDRRVDAYAELATAVFQLGHTTTTRGQHTARFVPEPAWLEFFVRIQDQWERANDRAAMAQHRALLVSDRSMYARIVEINDLTGRLIDASLRAGAKVDDESQQLLPPDPDAAQELGDLAMQLVDLKNAFLADAWRSIQEQRHGRRRSWTRWPWKTR